MGLTFKKGVHVHGLDGSSIRNTLKGGLLLKGAYFREGAYFPDYTVEIKPKLNIACKTKLAHMINHYKPIDFVHVNESCHAKTVKNISFIVIRRECLVAWSI